MSSHFVYIRGKPATGKITVARILEKEFGWRVFWFHELKNTVYDIVKEHRIPRLMDELTIPIIRFILDRGENLIYVRPSPDKETVEHASTVIAQYPDHKTHVFRLTASYEALVERATSRNDEYRISNKQDLDEYIQSRVEVDVPGEHIIDTTDKTAQQVAHEIATIIKKNV